METPKVLPEEAINLVPLSRFKYREAKIVYDPNAISWGWVVRCGHKSIHEFEGVGDSLQEAIFNAGIDDPPTFTD